MSYTPFLIANMATGVNTRLQPWLIPDDAQEQLFDGFVYRGVMSKREGYVYFATGQRGGSAYRESRIVTGLQGPITSPMVGVIDSANQTFTLDARAPIAAGTVVVTGSTPLQVLNDDGVGGFTGDGVGTVNYATGAISITFTTAPTAGTVSVTYQNAQNMVGAINSSNQLFTYAGPAQIARGSVTVRGSTPLQTFTDNGLGVFLNVVTPIGTVNYLTGAISITLPVAPTAGTVTVTFASMPGDPVMMIANFVTDVNVKELIVADTENINRYNSTTNVLDDITTTPYTGNKFQFFSWVNYASPTNTPRLIFSNNKDVIQQYDGTIVADYAYTMTSSVSPFNPVATLTCSWLTEFKDRLVLVRTTEDGIVYPQRIRISGTGANSDDFRTSATGAGFIDIPDGSWIMGATANRDDLLIFTQLSTWVMSYTGNDTTPFVIKRIDESRGSDATFSTITYLNRSSAVSKRGLIISDGYRVERQDNDIPDFTFNEIDQDNFALCFAGVVDKDRDHYLIYPDSGNTTSNRILTTNYDEDNYCTYRLPLSCMGVYQTAFVTVWNDLTEINGYPNWDALTTAFGDWNSFSYTKGTPFTVGGGQNGEIWRLVVSESEDNQIRVYSVTFVDETTMQIVGDFNNYSIQADEPEMGADLIFLTGMTGMTELNNQQFPITEIINANTFRINISACGVKGSDLTPYVSGGLATRVIPFSALMKEFNPYIDQDKKVRCGWLYMYVDTSETQLVRNLSIDSATQTFPCVITTEVPHGMKTGEQVTFFGVAGMTELNGLAAFVTVINATSFSLQGIDATGFTAYTSGGFVSIEVQAKIQVDVYTDDRQGGNYSQLNDNTPFPYEGNCTNISLETGTKKWYKVYINQVGKFIQFRFRNQQAGASIKIQAFMPGFQPLGRLI